MNFQRDSRDGTDFLRQRGKKPRICAGQSFVGIIVIE